LTKVILGTTSTQLTVFAISLTIQPWFIIS